MKLKFLTLFVLLNFSLVFSQNDKTVTLTVSAQGQTISEANGENPCVFVSTLVNGAISDEAEDEGAEEFSETDADHRIRDSAFLFDQRL